jgi:hypothetical protein
MIQAIPSSPLFQAEWPKELKPTVLSKTVDVAKEILSWVFLPSKILYYFAAIAIHPASALATSIDNVAREEIRQLGGQIVQWKTPDGETLEGAFFKGASGAKKGIVHAPGNNASFGTAAPHFVKFVRSHVGDVDILLLNYRGVGNSTGLSSPQGLALDVYSAGEYLHKEKKIDPSKILFYGHSLGGYAVVKGGAIFQEQHKDAKVSAVSDRSFSDLADAANHIAGSLFWLLAYLLQWQLDAKGAWETLKGRKLIVYHKDDNAIPYPVSFYNGMQRYLSNYNHPPLTSKETIELDQKNSWEAHNRGFSSSEANAIGAQISSALA